MNPDSLRHDSHFSSCWCPPSYPKTPSYRPVSLPIFVKDKYVDEDLE